jgi:hypothetical protein
MASARSVRRSGWVNLMRSLFVGLVAGVSMLSHCLGFDNIFTDMLIEELGDSIDYLQIQPSSSILEALHLQKQCSNEFPECQQPGHLADKSSLHCFIICFAIETGCRSCCSNKRCYKPSEDAGALGSCVPCSNRGYGQHEQYAFALNSTRNSFFRFLMGLLFHLVMH